MDSQWQPERNSFLFYIPVYLLTSGYILLNSADYFKVACAVSFSILTTLLLCLKDIVLMFEEDNPLKALKMRRLCLCVVSTFSLVIEAVALSEDMDRISRGLLLLGSRLMVLVPMALHCLFGEFEAVMDSLPGTGKGKHIHRMIMHIMTFTPICGFFLITAGDNPWKLAHCIFSYVFASLATPSGEMVNEWRLQSSVLVKRWRRVANFSLIMLLIVTMVVTYHTRPGSLPKYFMLESMGGLILIAVVAHVVGVEMEKGMCFRKLDEEKESANGENVREPKSMRISDDEFARLLVDLLQMFLLATSIIAVDLV